MLKCSEELLNYYLQAERQIGMFVRAEIWQDEKKRYDILDSDIDSGSLRIDRKSCSKSTFDIGEIYNSNAKFTILNRNLNVTGDLTGCEVRIFTGYDFGVRKEEIQVFTGIIPEKDVVREKMVTHIGCDDILCKFDAPAGSVATSGTSYELVTFCCSMCGVVFAMSEQEFNDLSLNSQYTLFLTADSPVRSFKDILMYVAQIMGCFAYATADGKLIFKSYSMDGAATITLNDDTFERSQYGSQAIQLDGMTWVKDNAEIYISGGQDSQYVLELAENPLVSSLTTDIWNIIGMNLWDQLSQLELQYINVSFNGIPVIEVGDIVAIHGGDIKSFVTSYSWAYHNRSSIECVTVDKRINTVSQGVKGATVSGGGRGGGNDLSVIRLLNSADTKIGTGWMNIVTTFFSCPSGVSPYMDVCAILELPVDGLLEARLYYDNVELYLPYRWTLKEGYFTIAFSKSFDASDADRIHSVKIMMRFTDNVNKAHLEQGYLEANIIAYKAITAMPEWTGIYELTDYVPKFSSRGRLRMKGIRESAPQITQKVWNY